MSWVSWIIFLKLQINPAWVHHEDSFSFLIVLRFVLHWFSVCVRLFVGKTPAANSFSQFHRLSSSLPSSRVVSVCARPPRRSPYWQLMAWLNYITGSHIQYLTPLLPPTLTSRHLSQPQTRSIRPWICPISPVPPGVLGFFPLRPPPPEGHMKQGIMGVQWRGRAVCSLAAPLLQ